MLSSTSADSNGALAAESELPIGAHIVTRRHGYTHHGIYAGVGQVVHYAGLSRGLRGGPVEETSLSRFAAGHLDCCAET